MVVKSTTKSTSNLTTLCLCISISVGEKVKVEKYIGNMEMMIQVSQVNECLLGWFGFWLALE